jgi:GNAT superfamily N-acetyltransferase
MTGPRGNLVVGGPVPAPVLAAATDLYARVFGAAPYLEPAERAGEFADRVRRYEHQREGTRLAWVVDGTTGRQVAMALGVVGVPGTWWRDRVAAALADPAMVERWLGVRCLEVVHVAVDPAHQRRGLGRLVLDLVTAGAPTPTAVLGCGPGVRGFYRRSGWTLVGGDSVTGQCLMGRRL